MHDKQVKEALNRMVTLKLSRQCINAFKEGKVWESEGYGALYELNAEEQKLVDDFQASTGHLVYHMIHNKFEFGECYTMLYVSKYLTEWNEDRNDLEDGYALCYVKNVTDDFCSEYGTVAIRPSFGGLVRIG